MKKSVDERFIRQCILLAEKSVDEGEAPFGSLIVKDAKIIAESGNGNKRYQDVSSHAEILVMRKAQQLLQTDDLSGYEIYSNCEPCPMCSFMMRELKFKRIIFALPSAIMGGYSKWPILQDTELEKIRPYFTKPPEITPNMLPHEAIKTFQRIGMEQMFKEE